MRRSAWTWLFVVCACARTIPTSPPPPPPRPPRPPPPPQLQIPAGCEATLTGDWQLESDSTFRYHFEDDGAQATVWVYRVFGPPDAGAPSRLFPRLARDAGVAARDAGMLKDGGMDLVAAGYIGADELLAKQRFEEAAKSYLEVVEADPKRDFAPVALIGAATAQESLEHFAEAAALLERLAREYPKSKLADAALARAAVNAERAGDLPRAIEGHQKLIKTYPASKEVEKAQLKVARLLAQANRPAEGATALLRFVELYPNSKEAPKALLEAALIHDRLGDIPKELAALNALIQKFPDLNDFVIDARKRIGDANLKLKKEPEAKRAYAAAAEEFDKRGLTPAVNPIAADAAAESRFQLAQLEAAQFEKLKLEGPALMKGFAAKKKASVSLTAAYDGVLKYERPQWSIASLTRKGDLLAGYARAIAEAPVPTGADGGVGDADPFQDFSGYLSQAAVDAYLEAVQRARTQGISNAFTNQATDALRRLRPDYTEASRSSRAQSRDGGELAPSLDLARDERNDAGIPDSGQEPYDAGTEHHHPLPADLLPQDGGVPPLATAVIHLRRTPQGFNGEAETIYLLPSGRECRATFPTRVAACGPATLTMVSAASTPVGDGCQTPALPRPAAQLEHRLARTDAGEL